MQPYDELKNEISSLSRSLDDPRRIEIKEKLVNYMKSANEAVITLLHDHSHPNLQARLGAMSAGENGRLHQLEHEVEVLGRLYDECLRFDDIDSIKKNNARIAQDLRAVIPALQTRNEDQEPYFPDWLYTVILEEGRVVEELERINHPGELAAAERQIIAEWRRYKKELFDIKEEARRWHKL